MSSKVKIGLLLAVHVIAGLLMAWYVNTHRLSPVSNWISTGLLTLVLAQAGLIGVWGGLSTIRLALRLPAVVAATALAWTVLFIMNPMAKLFDFLNITLTAVPILVVLSVLRYSRRRLRLAHLANESPVAKGIQFSIRHLLFATAIVAVVLGISRAVRASLDTQSGILLVGIFPPCGVMVELATLWAALGMGRPTLRLAVIVPTAFVVGTIPIGMFGFMWMLLSAHFGLQAIITAASLLVVRSCGWRLVCGAEITGVPAPEPTRRFRPQFSLWQLFLLVALVAVGFGTWHWLSRKAVVVRAPTPDDEELFADYMADLSRKRNVAVATGRFMKGTWLLVSLHIVQAGIAEHASDERAGRDEAITGGPVWETMNWGMSLNNIDAIGGQRTELTITYDTDDQIEEFDEVTGTSLCSQMTHNINAVAKQTLPGTITPGRPHIVCIEGDQAIVVDRKMTVEEFAEANPGNYLVVTVEIR